MPSLPGIISWIPNIQESTVIFNWDAYYLPDCPAVHYNILTSNCGSCPTTTNHTNATCTDVPIDGSVCIFAIQTVICGTITRELSREVLPFSSTIPGQLLLLL
jgi:hypothetical protein